MFSPFDLRGRWTPDDRQILRLAVPALAALIAEPLYILADTAVVGRLGTPQLGGLAVASSLLLIGYSVFIFLAYGTTATVARLLGAKQLRRAAHLAVQSLWLATLIGIVLAGLGWVFRGDLISLIGGEGDVGGHAEVYFRISLLGVPAMLITLAGVGYLRGLQDTKRPLYVALGTAILNLVIELVLIFGFNQGIGASALSTVIAQWIGAAVFVTWIRNAVKAHGVDLRPDVAVINSVARDGLDLFIRTAALRGSLTITLAVAARIGTEDLAAHQIAFEIWSLLALTLDSVAIAAQALIGMTLGSGDATRARDLGRRMIGWGLWCGVCLGVIVGLLSPVLGHVFSEDAAVVGLTAFLLIHVAVQQPVAGVVFALDGILIGAGNLRFLAVTMWIAAAVLIAGGLVVLATGAGIGWLWFCLEAWLISRAIMLVARFRTPKWQVTGAHR
ncbi:MAG: MATE family efflux transporter [Acidimicrobiia bacterium]|nr:MATE family efflux transporter [Acidimicrobiia bacterium]MCY4456863.1 MATE family efflux transporter [Acidimicrobiaceae bacterium]